MGRNSGQKKRISGKNILRPKYATAWRHLPKGILEGEKSCTFKSRFDKAIE